MPTYTSSSQKVTDGDTTTHDTTNVASENINITSAQIRWQGVTTTDSFTDFKINESSSNDFDIPDGYSVQMGTSVPPLESGTNFLKHEILIQHDDHQNEDWSIHVNKVHIFDPDNSEYIKTWNVDEDKTLQSTDTRVANTALGQFTDINTNYADKGYEAIIDLTNTNGSEIQVKNFTQTWGTFQNTTTYKTTDPNVTKDVSGSYTGTLDDGVWSAWQTLTGLSNGVNEFYHNIDSSNEAYFEFEYTYEYTYPTAQKQMRIGSRDGSQIHKIALADPTDSALQYDHVRVLVGGTVYAVDVVDPGDADALDWFRIGTPNYGTVCPRAYETVSTSDSTSDSPDVKV